MYSYKLPKIFSASQTIAKMKIITIDGPASAGKTVIAKKISKYFNSPVLFSGQLYRSIALLMIKKKIRQQDKGNIIKCINEIKNLELSTHDLYTAEIDKLSSTISTKKYVRDNLLKLQRGFPLQFPKRTKFCIIEGRDIGTVVFPEADHKFFMWANADIRAQRRLVQYLKNGKKARLNKIYEEILKRDRKDFNRKIAPLKPAVNSVLLDTSYLDIEQVFKAIHEVLINKINDKRNDKSKPIIRI